MPNKKRKLSRKKKKSNSRKCDNGGIEGIFPPFNKFAYKSTRVGDTLNKISYESTYRSTGLSPKEKSYVICKCQSRSTRYVKLKNLASNAIRYNKIFSVYGSCNAIRNALLERGWVEKIPSNRMNLSKIRNGTCSNKSEIHSELERLLLSNLVEKCNPNFIWRTKDEIYDTTIDMTKDYNTIVNKLNTDALWTTKQGLCSSMKRNYWFYIDNIAEVNGPRTYNSYDGGEIEGFIKDYKITACTSLLKWILSMVANERPVFMKSGKVSMTVVVFALNRCKEYLFRKQNKDIDHTLPSVSKGQWNAFLKKYYQIIAKDDVFQADTENKLPLYLGYANFLLKEIHRYRPQLSCEGCHNIWIIKPAYCSRGRGIRMASKLGVITNLLNKANAKHVIQKYIEEPLLIYDTKFDIRQYYLVTSTYPLTIWMYANCYLKFSSQKYNLNNYHESIHLTNNAIQKKYKNYIGRHPDLPQSNMWDLEEYKDYLNRCGKSQVWDNIVYPGMKKSIIGIMLSCQDSLSISKNRFELYGCDFILDKEYKPWLIEINSCPDLNNTTQVTAKICPDVVSDIVKVIIDYAENPNSSTGKFECIYRQSMTVPRYGTAADIFVRGYRLSSEYFFKGKIEINEIYEDANIGKERDIKATLDKLKRLYETDIMMESEDDYNSIKKLQQETCSHNTQSENELCVAATVITEQLDKLMDGIDSENSIRLKSGRNKVLSSVFSKTSTCHIPMRRL
ncbi:tubulin glycylase 3A-like isoform X2 [Achroia grisella]|nr:tubulin glycylase 3A-like isoform X2 [Achroia grisella]XP_059059347.1 tubulin glycylase 3A-like isoform X2 [Achroia grisella]XP_059059348.1 tubulin glycylase 3A-like isoform X2 [Achroia grisella]XP_059059350.1 tubulin glycylase 3A-like isoform X2 [Achroia grisella]XP_059059351.1 tubulin glycylase 3A-like isoform X2 [Achroia grisella]XP_059059352.1 tubulin glycylase 3A-like isoform X2 [Achroia grisella]